MVELALSVQSSRYAARADSSGAYPIRIYTLGLVTANLGTIPETSESVLKRIANDKSSPDFNSAARGQVLLPADA